MPQQRDSIPHIRGVVMDGVDNSILPGANITLKGQGIFTVSDSLGKFELDLPQNYQEKTVTLEIQYIGYLLNEFVVPLAHATSEMKFPMEPLKSDSMQVVVAGAIAVVRKERANFWQRIKYKARHVFH